MKHLYLQVATWCLCCSRWLLLQGWFVDAFEHEIEEFFATGCDQARVACEHAHYQACSKITAQRLCHLRWGETLHKIEGAVPLFVAVIGDALVNHVSDVHVTTETCLPGLIETFKEGGGGIACFDCFGSNGASHLARVNGEANAFSHEC